MRRCWDKIGTKLNEFLPTLEPGAELFVGRSGDDTRWRCEVERATTNGGETKLATTNNNSFVAVLRGRRYAADTLETAVGT